jgi:signal transduction histidine kinase
MRKESIFISFRLRITALVVSVAFFIGANWVWHQEVTRSSDHLSVAAQAGKALSGLEAATAAEISTLAEQIDQNGLQAAFRFKPKVEWLSVFIYNQDSLIWWSDNNTAPSINELKPGIRHYRNGWYHFTKKETKGYTIAGLLKIKNQYPYQNRFLVNSFHPALCVPDQYLLSLQDGENRFPVSGSSDELYLGIHPSESISPDGKTASLLFVASFILFAIFLWLVVAGKPRFKLAAATTVLVFFICLKAAGVIFQYPAALYSLPLFSPSHYASSLLLNSLGDLLFSVAILAGLIVIVFRTPWMRKGHHPLPDNQRSSISIGMVASVSIPVAFIILYSAFINYLIAGLIINSRISFNISNVFELDGYSLAGVTVTGILLFSFFKVTEGFVRYMQSSKAGVVTVAVTGLITGSLLFVLFLQMDDATLFSDYTLISLLLTLLLTAFTYWIRTRTATLNFFTRSMLTIFAFSLFGAHAISSYNNLKEQENRKVLAAKLENEQDQVAEYLFDDLATAIAGDVVVTRFFSLPFEEALAGMEETNVIEKRLQQLYFTGYWSRYDVSVRIFNNEGLPINRGGDPTWSIDFFNVRIRESSQPTSSRYLYFSGNNSGRVTYTGMIPVFSADDRNVQNGTIAVSLVSKLLPGEGGFPELLLSEKVPQRRDISNYSFASYRDHVLNNQSGSFSYMVSDRSYEKFLDPDQQYQFHHRGGYCHLFYRSSPESLLVISTKMPEVPEYLTFFSYLFSFYALCFILIYVLMALLRGRDQIAFNFKNRIQATVIVIVIATMLMIGGATVFYIFRNHSGNINANANERMRSMLLAIRDELSARSLDAMDISDEMNYTFSRIAGILNTDFSIFSQQGQLLYSTQPKIYDQQLMARTMNRSAMNALSGEGQSLYIQYEEIGKLSFLSAYEPVRNNNNEIIGYINLPYFSRQDELKKDISAFLVALINIYVLLFAAAIFLTFIISNRITQPLQIIQQRLSRITLGKRNELIEWNRDDEIGALVKEYNRMVEELTESADKLARSERESAWREMAKQVAHEIKNPLTPMKLSVQHLQRAWKEQHPDLERIMQRFSQTLIEQIDTLSNIATEFSNFAKMPKANRERTDLSQVIRNVVALHSANENVTITFYEHPGNAYFVYADREQMVRVFTNLIKNAIQAIPDNRSGHVHIEMKKENGMIRVNVKDNGIGIPDSERDRIFTPNFTTKTGGMGLGLAMVKNIVDLSGGNISFESETDAGTVFTLVLPYFAEDHSGLKK